MINGLYNSASGMNAELAKQETVANNLANVSTVGFKKDDAIFTSFPNALVSRIDDKLKSGLPAFVAPSPSTVLGVVGHGVQIEGVVTKFTDGGVTLTNRPLDLALHGQALFTVERPDGSHAYTRAGNFVMNAAGQLATQDGNLVLGTAGDPISVDGKEVVVDTAGRVTSDGIETGRLQLAAWDPTRMVKQGEGLYVRSEADIEAVEESPAPQATVTQGYLEEANTKVVEEMVQMITVTRAYEANQKAIQMQDESLGKAINEVGRV
jgi:flagellar basal-body rod protein FlgF